MAQRRVRPSDAVMKRLFAKSGNLCAFPKCGTQLVQGHTLVAEVCHIRAASELGPRFDATQSNEERHGFDNLILLCPNHHTVVDDDVEAYTVNRLVKMKRDHEERATALTDPEVSLGATLLVDQSVTIMSMTGSVIANHIHVHHGQSYAATEDEQIARARKVHLVRITEIVNGAPAVAMLSKDALVLHVIPLPSVDSQDEIDFDRIQAHSHRFPPMPNTYLRDQKVTYDGLLTGSNANGLTEPQRAYVHVSRGGVVESVWSSMVSNASPKFVELPQVEAAVVKFAMIYIQALSASGAAPPFLVAVSMIGFDGVRLLQNFVGRSLVVDVPYVQLPAKALTFTAVVFDAVPETIAAAARVLRPLLTHLANAAGLSESPSFAADGTTDLTL